MKWIGNAAGTIRRFAALAAFSAVIAGSAIVSTATVGCAFFEGAKSSQKANESTLNDIGARFEGYILGDANLHESERATSLLVLREWRAGKATKATYEHIAPRYVTYIRNDASLTEEQKENRLDSLDAWLVNIKAHAGEL